MEKLNTKNILGNILNKKRINHENVNPKINFSKNKKDEKENCPDCGVKPGQLHKTNCDMERCGICKGQRLSCKCKKPNPTKNRIWSGRY